MHIDRTCFKSCLESTEEILTPEVHSISIFYRSMVNHKVYTTLGNPICIKPDFNTPSVRTSSCSILPRKTLSYMLCLRSMISMAKHL